MKKIIFLLITFFFLNNVYSLHISLPEVQYKLARDLYIKERYNDAILEFNNLINEHPSEINYIGNSYYWLGLCYLNLSNYKLAEKNFKKVVDTFPNSKYYIDSLYQLGRTYYLSGRKKTAIKIFTQIYKKYPRHELADNALLWRGVCYYKLNNTKKALNDFYTILKDYKNSNKEDAARYMITYIKGRRVIVAKAEIDTSKLAELDELLKTKEQALKEKELELQTKETVLSEKEKIINQAQEKLIK